MDMKLSELTSRLYNEVDRLLNTENVCVDAESTKQEVEKAQAITGLADQIIKIKETQIKETSTNVMAVKALQEVGYKFTPEGMNLKPLPELEKLKGYTKEGLRYEL